MSLTEEQMRIVEERIPEQGSLAIQKALAKARASGRSVTVRVGDDLVELRPNGDKAFLKKLRPKVPTQQGQRIKLR